MIVNEKVQKDEESVCIFHGRPYYIRKILVHAQKEVVICRMCDKSIWQSNLISQN